MNPKSYPDHALSIFYALATTIAAAIALLQSPLANAGEQQPCVGVLVGTLEDRHGWEVNLAKNHLIAAGCEVIDWTGHGSREIPSDVAEQSKAELRRVLDQTIPNNQDDPTRRRIYVAHIGHQYYFRSYHQDAKFVLRGYSMKWRDFFDWIEPKHELRIFSSVCGPTVGLALQDYLNQRPELNANWCSVSSGDPSDLHFTPPMTSKTWTTLSELLRSTLEGKSLLQSKRALLTPVSGAVMYLSLAMQSSNARDLRSFYDGASLSSEWFQSGDAYARCNESPSEIELPRVREKVDFVNRELERAKRYLQTWILTSREEAQIYDILPDVILNAGREDWSAIRLGLEKSFGELNDVLRSLSSAEWDSLPALDRTMLEDLKRQTIVVQSQAAYSQDAFWQKSALNSFSKVLPAIYGVSPAPDMTVSGTLEWVNAMKNRMECKLNPEVACQCSDELTPTASPFKCTVLDEVILSGAGQYAGSSVDNGEVRSYYSTDFQDQRFTSSSKRFMGGFARALVIKNSGQQFSASYGIASDYSRYGRRALEYWRQTDLTTFKQFNRLYGDVEALIYRINEWNALRNKSGDCAKQFRKTIERLRSCEGFPTLSN